MLVKDVILLSDPKSEELLVRQEGTSVKSANGYASDDLPRTQIVLDAHQRAIEQALYFSACAEQGSEHPIAKGTSTGYAMFLHSFLFF
jgi:hypothetical protein